MKRSILVLTLAMLFSLALFGSQVLAAEFSPALEAQLNQAKGTDFVSAIVILESPIDIRALDDKLHNEKASKAKRHADVLSALHYNADNTQPKIRAELDQAKANGVLKGYTAYWIENLFVISATKDFIESLRERGDIKYVTENFKAELIEPIHSNTKESERGDHNSLDTRTLAVGVQEVGALRVNEELGITGNGVLIGDCDTGADGTHPALAARWRGNFAPWWQCWKDNANHVSQFPEDLDASSSHGTHTLGTMTGRAVNGTDTTWVGCAPNARWIANNAIRMGVGSTFDNEIVASYQWFTDPDTVSHDVNAVPDVINNSWGTNTNLGYVQCYDYWNTVMMNCEAGGSVVVFAAGNEGSSGLRSPAIYSINSWQFFAVGAVDGTTNTTPPYPIASFSSLGPTPCTPASPNDIKPEISGPGVNVFSSVNGGGYSGSWSGTSMATPHISGIVALMREACPNCDPQTIKTTLMNTAIRTGYVTPPATENNTFGNGFVDGYAAVLAVSNLGHVVGVVRDASNNPLAGVTVSNPAGAQSVVTNATGNYDLPLSAGTYTLRFAKFAYVTQNISGIVVTTGNNTTQNVTLQLAPTGTLQGTVTSCAGGPAVGATVTILNTSLTPATTDAAGHYIFSSIPQGTYDVSAAGAGCGTQTITGVVVGANTTQNFTLPTDPRFLCSAADAGGYVACENGDASGPTYVWLEISPSAGGPGTIASSVTGDDAGQSVTLPFTFRMYGQSYTSVWICTNGFVSFSTTSTAYSNEALPSSTIGYAICPFWDDMTVSGTGADVSYYTYAAQNAFIIEWHAVPHLSGSNPETFQVWLYNVATNPGPNGDSQIRMQYQTVSLGTSCTVGTQSGTVANQYVRDNVLDPNAQGLANSRVITYGGTTTPTFGVLAGTVTDCNAQPAANATITFPGSFYPSITADANGHYSQNMVPGTYDVRADKLPCTYIRVNGNVVTANQTTTRNLTLRAPTAIQGTVTNCSGGVAAGATISFPGASPAIPDITTDAAGHYYQTVPGGTTYIVGAAKFPCSAVQSPATQVNETQTISVNLTLGAPGTLQGTVTSCTGGPAVGATVSLTGTTIPSVTTNASGFYQFLSIPAGTYNAVIAFAGCWSDSSFGHVVNSGTATTYNVTLISNPALSCSPPDGYGYAACEDVDPNGPVFAWRGIAPLEGGAGTAVTGLLDDNFVGPFTCPFTMKVYGTDYTQYYVGSNGYMTFGAGYGGIPYSCPMPMTDFPVGYYPMGDDMYPPLGGQVATYYDAAQHLFILEYYQINHYSTGPIETFEIIIYDPIYYPTATGDCDVTFQYNAANSVASCDIGIQNAGAIANNWWCNGTGPATSFGPAVGRAVKFSTGAGCVGSPSVAVTPNNLSKSVPLNGSTTDSLYLCNTGPCPLNWSAAWVQISPAALVSSLEATASPNMPKDLAMGIATVVPKDKTRVANEYRGRNQLDNQGGPDTFGYSWIDSNQAGGPVFNWVKINGIGTNTGLSADDGTVLVSLPWLFSFYGNSYSDVNISSNGNLQFGTAPNSAYLNSAIPSTDAPLNMIAPFWDDLNNLTSGTIWYYNDAANNRFIIEYDAVPKYDESGTVTFEVMLYADSRIVFQYNSLLGDVLSCTVGQQNATGTDGLQVVYNAAYLTNGLAIQFTATPPVPHWISFPAGSSGQVQSNQCSWLHVNFNSTGLTTGLYSGNIVLTNNDIAHNPVMIPVTFQVGQLNPPTQLTLFYLSATNELQLRWTATSAPMYKILSSTSPSGPFNTIVGTTNQTSYTIPFPSAQTKLYYSVLSTDAAFESAPGGPANTPSTK